MQNNKMCKKTVYWDLINSNMNMNGRDVQTGCSGYVHKNTGDESMDVSSNNLVSVYETGFVLNLIFSVQIKGTPVVYPKILTC